ncbi:MAG: hypothetical protein FWD71_13240 [Oscillospiraceae bacterium]|nr:hypothetical protein [Oscillospiraceae bacterium]
MLMKKLEMINYLNKRDKKIKFRKAEDKYTSLPAAKKARQLLWKINSGHLPLLQNASYCYSFVWILAGLDNLYENKKYYVVDIYDDKTYARILKNPAEIYRLPQAGDKIPYTKLYNNINRIVKSFLSRQKHGEI